MDDDFNTPILISHLFDGVRIINSVKNGKETLTVSDINKLQFIFNTFFKEILGLLAEKESSENDITNNIMELLLTLRNNAKNQKDFKTADLIRADLEKIGIEIKDSREGSFWDFKN